MMSPFLFLDTTHNFDNNVCFISCNEGERETEVDREKESLSAEDGDALVK